MVANADGYGSDIFVRCYPPSVDPQTEFQRELSNPTILKNNSDYTSAFFKWLSAKDNLYGQNIAISKTSAAFYTSFGQPYVALRLYMLSPFITEHSAKELVTIIATAKVEFDRILQRNAFPSLKASP